MADLAYVTLDDRQLKAVLSRFSLRALHPAAAMDRAGDQIAALYRTAIAEEHSPETDTPFPALSARTQEAFIHPHRRGAVSGATQRRRRRHPQQRRGGEHILQAAQVPGYLATHIVSTVSASGFTLMVGEKGAGAIAHRQEFGEGRTPARPFIQVGPRIEQILTDALLASLL